MPTEQELRDAFLRVLSGLDPEEIGFEADKLAEQELAAVNKAEELTAVEGRAKRLRILRGIELRKVIHNVVRGFVYFAAGLLAVAVAVWIWHILAPTELRWLSADEISRLQAMLFSGSISALVTASARTAIKD